MHLSNVLDCVNLNNFFSECLSNLACFALCYLLSCNTYVRAVTVIFKPVMRLHFDKSTSPKQGCSTFC